MTDVSFVSEQIPFLCPEQDSLIKWLEDVCSKESKTINTLTYIFCSDEYLLEINQKFLRHDYYTDVITFDYSEENAISGDLFISVDRVKDNAQAIDVQFIDELHRVIVHGLLHLLGYKDKTPSDKEVMTGREDFYLSLRSF